MKHIIKRQVITLGYTETLNMGDFSSIKPTYSEEIEYDPSCLPSGMTEDQFRENFWALVRDRYSKVRNLAIQDFDKLKQGK